MKAACPKCGRGTVVEEDIGDFPTRCVRCGALVRRRREKPECPSPAETMACAQIPRGMLADLLSRGVEEPGAIIHAHIQTPETSRTRAAGRGLLGWEAQREIRRVRTRQQAVRKAELKVSQQALGVLTWAGLALVIVLGIGVLALKTQALWR